MLSLLSKGFEKFSFITDSRDFARIWPKYRPYGGSYARHRRVACLGINEGKRSFLFSFCNIFQRLV